MKKYVTPVITCVELRVEESISAVAGCVIGSCDSNHDGIYEYVTPSAS